ncbi:MAG TPA: ABC transporter ATP-binding protein [Longimicrobiaceae bacterium]|jgi:ATP-binding cassette subfamily B protein
MRENWRGLRLLVGTAWRADPWRSAGLLLEPVGQLAAPLFAWFLKMMVDGATRQDMRLIALGAGGIILVRAIGFMSGWAGGWIRLRLSEQVGFVLDREIATLTAGIPGVEHHERADYMDQLELLRQRQGVLGNSLNSLINTANAVVAGVGTLVLLLFATPWLLFLVPFALPAVPFAAIKQRWFRQAEEIGAPVARRARYLQELTVDRNAGMELRVFGLQREVLARFRRSWMESQTIGLDVERRMMLLDTVADLIFVVGFTGAVGLMLWRASRGQATVGDVVMAIYLTQQLRGRIVAPIWWISSLGEALRAAGRVLWLRDYARSATLTRGGSRPAPARLVDGIVFDRVSFRYPGTEQWALRDVSFRIPAGSVIALVGENGAGKTTLVKLLSRMYEPTEGRILVDGVDLAEIEVGAWRERLSAAFQDFVRLELTAQHSVGVGDLPRLDDQGAVRVALERAGAADVLGKLPEGTATRLGSRWDGGVDMSTGQWQKLALGRALMRGDPLVVFFDEPTASLDALAEHALFEHYTREARTGSERGAITVLVSHRFSTVRSADTILVIAGGGVAELGSHEELLLRDGLYASLYQLQARAYA